MKRREFIKTLAGIALASGVPSVFAKKEETFKLDPERSIIADPDDLEGLFGYNGINIRYLSDEEAETAGYSMIVEGPETGVTMQELYSFVEEAWSCAGPDVV